jgi:hypothetical protein
MAVEPGYNRKFRLMAAGYVGAIQFIAAGGISSTVQSIQLFEYHYIISATAVPAVQVTTSRRSW